MIQLIVATRSWHVLVRIGVATVAVVVITALQSLAAVEVPGEPFLLSFIVVVVSAVMFGRALGFLAAAESSIASLLLANAVDFLPIAA
jgi:hypothetical protein